MVVVQYSFSGTTVFVTGAGGSVGFGLYTIGVSVTVAGGSVGFGLYTIGVLVTVAGGSVDFELYTVGVLSSSPPFGVVVGP